MIRVLLLTFQTSSIQMDWKHTYCVGGRHQPNTIYKSEYEQVDPKTIETSSWE